MNEAERKVTARLAKYIRAEAEKSKKAKHPIDVFVWALYEASNNWALNEYGRSLHEVAPEIANLFNRAKHQLENNKDISKPLASMIANSINYLFDPMGLVGYSPFSLNLVGAKSSRTGNHRIINHPYWTL